MRNPLHAPCLDFNQRTTGNLLRTLQTSMVVSKPLQSSWSLTDLCEGFQTSSALQSCSEVCKPSQSSVSFQTIILVLRMYMHEYVCLYKHTHQDKKHFGYIHTLHPVYFKIHITYIHTYTHAHTQQTSR